MRRLGKVLATLGAVTGAIWLLRERLVTVTTSREPELPRFRDEPSADPLQEIVGIGPAYHQALADIGITTFAELAGADAAEIAASLHIPAGRVAPWIEQAAQRPPVSD